MSVKIRTRKTQKGISYYLVTYVGGDVSSRTLKIDYTLPEKQRREIAEIIRAEKQKELMTDSFGLTANININFIQAFEEHVKSRRQLAGINKYKQCLAHLKKHFGVQLNVRQLNANTLETWKGYLVTNFTGETPLTLWRCTIAVINSLRKRGDIKHNPAHEVKPPRGTATLSKQILSTDEIAKLAETPMSNAIICRAFLFCCLTGMGRMDLKHLKWSDIDRSRKQIRYKRAKTGRSVPVDIEIETLDLLPDQTESEYVFVHMQSDSYFSRMLKSWVKAAGITKNISFYCARHTFAIMLLEGGADIRVVSDLLGHASLKHTVRYLPYVDALKRKAVKTLPKIVLKG